MRSEILYEEGSHRWLMFGRDPHKPDKIIDTNQYMLVHNGQAMLLDPGGIELFSAMLSMCCERNITRANYPSICIASRSRHHLLPWTLGQNHPLSNTPFTLALGRLYSSFWYGIYHLCSDLRSRWNSVISRVRYSIYSCPLYAFFRKLFRL